MTQDQTTKARLIGAAAKLMGLHGVQAVSVEDIAAEAGFSKRTLYYHFKTKNELIAAWLQARSLATSGAPATEISDPRGAILAVFDALDAYIESPQFRGCPFILTRVEVGSDAHPAYPVALGHKERRRAWFVDLVTRIGLDNPVNKAEEIMVIWEGCWASSMIFRDQTPAKAARRLVERILG